MYCSCWGLARCFLATYQWLVYHDSGNRTLKRSAYFDQVAALYFCCCSLWHAGAALQVGCSRLVANGEIASIRSSPCPAYFPVLDLNLIQVVSYPF